MAFELKRNQNRILKGISLGVTAAVLLSLVAADFSRADEHAPDIYNVDIRDVATFHGSRFPEAQAVLASMIDSPHHYFPEGVTFARDGVGKPVRHLIGGCGIASREKRALINSVYGVEILGAPMYYRDGTVDMSVLAMIHVKPAGFSFRKYTVRASGTPLVVTHVALAEEFPLSDTQFSLEAGLTDRKAVLKDSRHGIVKIYPLGVGGFDEGITRSSKGATRLVTPMFKDATIRRNGTIDSRSDHSYYCGMPFIRIFRKDGAYTPIGFHIIQNREMKRGFDSHGCMRLREKDLYELHAVLKNHEQKDLLVNVGFKTAERAEHPYPLRDDGYQGVVDCSNPRILPKSCSPEGLASARPRRASSCRDSHGLILMKDYKCTPPVADIRGLNGDDMDPADMNEMDGSHQPEWLNQLDSIIENIDFGDERP